LLLLGWLAGCGAARSATPRKPPVAAEVAPTGATCARAQILEAAADEAAQSGSLLRARRLGEQAAALCSNATRALTRARETLAGAGDPQQLLQLAAEARAVGGLASARRHESLAAALLERRQRASLSVVQRWSADSVHHLEKPPYSVSTLDGQVLVMSTQTGKLYARVKQPVRDGDPIPFDADLDPSGERLLLRTEDTSAAAAPAPACVSRLDLFDARTSRWLKQECASDWVFSPDGSRLAIARIVDWDEDAVMRLVVLDAKTLEPVLELQEPRHLVELSIAADGLTLAATWQDRVSLTNLRTGRTEYWKGPVGQQPSSVAFGGKLAVWRVGSTLSTGSSSSGRVASSDLGACNEGRFSDLALSPSGQRASTQCGNAVTLWELAADAERKPRKSGTVPRLGGQIHAVEWLAGERGLLVSLDRRNRATQALFDAKLGRWVPLGEADERIQVLDTRTRLVIVGREIADGRLLYLDAALSPKPVPLPGCGASTLVAIDDVSAVATCGNSELAFVVDTRSLTARSFPADACQPIVHGQTLISGCYLELALRDLRTGRLLESTPIAPSSMLREGWWDGDAFIAPVRFQGRRVQRVSHFGASLRSTTEATPSYEECPERRGKIAWSAQPPRSICDRRSGRRIGEIPTNAVSPDARALLSDDARQVVSNDEAPLLADVASAQPVSLSDAPHHMTFVGHELLFGSVGTDEWGFWSAVTGRRLSRSVAPLADVPLLADAALGVAIEPGDALRVLDFTTGDALERIAAKLDGDMELSQEGRLTIVEPSRVSFWQVPHARRLGVLLDHPKTGEVAFLSDGQGFEVSGEPTLWRDVLRCQVGLEELPLEICIDALFEAGVGARGLLAR
jgi:hypothetical protein